VIDVGDLVVSPGLVDAHVHVNEPGRTEWEGFATATRAAAAGGVTTIVDMPLNASPVTTSRAALDAKIAASRGQLAIDAGFWAGVVPGNAAALIELAQAGVLGGKAFMVPSGIDEFPHVGERELREAMPVLRDYGFPCSPTPSSTSGSMRARRRRPIRGRTPAIWRPGHAPGKTPRSRC
jgi:allantoinase